MMRCRDHLHTSGLVRNLPELEGMALICDCAREDRCGADVLAMEFLFEHTGSYEREQDVRIGYQPYASGRSRGPAQGALRHILFSMVVKGALDSTPMP